MVSLNLNEKLFAPKDGFDDLEGEALEDALIEWFYSNFENPVESTSYNGREGGYLYTLGGPYDAREQIDGYFGDTISEETKEAVVERLERDSDEWAPNSNRIYDEDPPDDEADGDDYVILQRSLNELEAVLEQVPTVPSAIGGNNPPEDIGVPPYTDEDKAEIKASISVLRQSEMTLQLTDKVNALDAAEKIKSRADKLREFFIKHGTLAADEFSKELGKKAATAVVVVSTLAGMSLWSHLHAKLLAVYHAAQALFAF